MPSHTRTIHTRFLPLILATSCIFLTAISLAGCTVPDNTSNPPGGVSPTPTSPMLELTPTTTAAISEAEARKLATTKDSACQVVGTIDAVEVYNPNSQTWWFTLTPHQPQPGCKPACVVSAQGQVEVNWRCSGLQPAE